MSKLKQTIYRGSVAIGVMALAAVPLYPVSAQSATEDTTINASVDSTITITTSGSVNITLMPGSSPVVSSASDTVTVNTNATTGYELTLANVDASTNLVSGGSDTIAAHAGTPGTPTALADNTWGFAVAGSPFDTSYIAENNNDSSTSLWAGVPASSGTAATLKTTSSPASNDVTTVWYGVRVNASQPNGNYTDTVRYTAAVNP